MVRILLKQQEHLQVKTEETRLARLQCFCLHCQQLCSSASGAAAGPALPVLYITSCNPVCFPCESTNVKQKQRASCFNLKKKLPPPHAQIQEMSFQRKLHARAAALASDVLRAAKELFIKPNNEILLLLK